MAQEIERKYLVKKEYWNHHGYSCEKIRQGYLSLEPEKIIRVRLTQETAWLTLKGLAKGITRPEYEYEIPPKDAEELLKLFSVAEVSKDRYHVEFAGRHWVVDEFWGDNLGLITAEIEMEHETEEIALPEWIDREVSYDARYFNVSLATHPYTQWPQKT